MTQHRLQGQEPLGILVAGGTGSRLFPSTRVVNKHILPVFDKPMIFYPLSTLMVAGLRRIVIVSTSEGVDAIRALLGEGGAIGVSLAYAVQDRPLGIVDAIERGITASGEASAYWCALGDNIFHGAGMGHLLRESSGKPGAVVFGVRVLDGRPFGVVHCDEDGKPVSLVEKPLTPGPATALTGLYRFPAQLSEVLGRISPSSRGEREVTDLNRTFLEEGTLELVTLPRGSTWIDAGTTEDLFQASNLVRSLQARESVLVGCPFEVGFRNGWIDSSDLSAAAASFAGSQYAAHLAQLANEV